MINAAEAIALARFIKNRSKDNFYDFILEGSIKHLAEIQDENIETLLDAADAVGLTYLSITPAEFVGAENARFNGWPAVWAIPEMVGLRKSCGNTDQTQYTGGNACFGKHIGDWNVKERRKLTEEESQKLKFPHVVSADYYYNLNDWD